MKSLGTFLARWLLCSVVVASAAAEEPPFLVERVASGDLPPMAERLPEVPLVTAPGVGQELGRYGGAMRMLMGGAKDVRMMVVYGYGRLVSYDQNYELVPDILESVDVDEGRIFTLHLRQGHRWSDGEPFTSEDFRYYWEDIANDSDLSPFGPSQELLVDGKPPLIEYLDSHTVRYAWAQPNPLFLPSLAGASPLYIYRPAHYLRQFHGRFADPQELERLLRESGMRDWPALHHRKDHQYKSDNPDLPVLQPWCNTTMPPAERFVFERNPFFHRVDPQGRQLPYLDKVIVNITDNKLVPAKTGAGESDLQARYLRFDNYTFLKDAEKRNPFKVRLWRTGRGGQVVLYPNLNVDDPAWREVLRDVRFRRALSLALNRHEINEVVYYGLVDEGNNTVRPESTLFQPAYRLAWAERDLELANRLLDEMGLSRRDDRGLRLLPDGRSMQLVVDSAGESTEETDVLELVRDAWQQVGIRLFSRPSQLEVFRNRIFAGQAIMSVWAGLDNGIPTPDMSPAELAPTSQVQLQWPKWGQFYETNGEAGEPPDLPEAQALLALYEAWRSTESREQREEIWHRMLAIHADQVFTIGTVSGVRQPVVISDRLHNVPEEGVYSWDPGAYFGIYRPELFWMSDANH
jgi:peptide/nickel transport system substrate-binding protein